MSSLLSTWPGMIQRTLEVTDVSRVELQIAWSHIDSRPKSAKLAASVYLSSSMYVRVCDSRWLPMRGLSEAVVVYEAEAKLVSHILPCKNDSVLYP